MPISIHANFCEQGFGFAGRAYRRGISIKHFTPRARWFGTCTCDEHTAACATFFNKREFTIPVEVACGIINREVSRETDAWRGVVELYCSYLTEASEVAEMCTRIPGSSGVARQWGIASERVWLQATSATVRELIRHGADTKQLVLRWEGGGGADAWAVAKYKEWLTGSRVPLDLHRQLFFLACVALSVFPKELRAIILRHCFTDAAGLSM